VPISKIRNFNPSTLEDFDRKTWYRVKGAAKYWNDGKEHSAYALIGGLAGKFADRKKKRLCPPPSEWILALAGSILPEAGKADFYF